MTKVRRVAPCWSCDGLITYDDDPCPHCGELEPGPASFAKAEHNHRIEMAYLESIRQRQEQFLNRNSVWLSLIVAVFFLALVVIAIDIFNAWSLLSFWLRPA